MVNSLSISQLGYFCDDYLPLAEGTIQSSCLHVSTNPAQFVSTGARNNHASYLASRSEQQ